MRPIVQEDKTGCAIASAAAIAGVTYQDAKNKATHLGISINDSALWSNKSHVLKLLKELGVQTSNTKETFAAWEVLPNCALLPIKWGKENGQPYWHWVVFVRDGDQSYVLDSNKSLKSNIRKDFGRMKPNWFIEVER